MKQIICDKIFTVAEYIHYELASESRHEFINGQLFEIAGGKDINNELALALAFMLMQLPKSKGYQVYANDVKIGIPHEAKYYYPDVFVTKEAKTEGNKYIKSEPELIIEVVSESTQINDYVDKYINYTKIPSLQYYMIVEPETTLITLYARENGGWVTHKYTNKEDEVQLPFLGIALPLIK
ncbi:Uma2 family endonuclease, partial [Parasediminibacterium sp. JCM 36343]|uniref:Uma2 family endonuclease n=1 Tax=Parasediminibacterium sp. JCM 36343 TaxID=3374279 RepID=UPI00397B7388